MDDYSMPFISGTDDPQGLLDLPQKCDSAEVERALRMWVVGLNGGDSLKVATLRENVIQELRARGITGPAKLVDAALATRACSPKRDPLRSANAENLSISREAGRAFLEHPRPLEVLEDSLRCM